MYNGLMKLPDRRPEEVTRRASRRRLLRWLLVGVLAALVVLVILERPLPDAPAPGGSGGPGPAVVTDTPAMAEVVASATPTATVAPSSTAEPTAPPTALPSPTATFTPTEEPSPTPTATPDLPPPPTATSVPLAGRVEAGTYHSALTGQIESYRIYLPPDYDQTERSYPALYLLHGWPYDETHWDNLGVDETADAGVVQGTLPALIIVLPGANSNGLYVSTSGGPHSFEAQVVNELIPHIDATYRTVQTREARAIGGISRGGVWALEIAFSHPDAFGSVGAHSPALSANRAPPAYDPFTLLREPGVETLRIYLSAGDGDWARGETWELHQALNEQGIQNHFVTHPGVHADPLWAEHIAEYLAFYTAGW